jgi:hypothetical protein
MSESELVGIIEESGAEFGIEEADCGDDGFYAYLNGGYLPNCYPTEGAALKAIAQQLDLIP